MASVDAKPEDFKANKLFVALEKAMQEDNDNLIEKVRGIFAIKVKNGAGGKDGYWVINAKTGKGSVQFNGKSKFIINKSNSIVAQNIINLSDCSQT